MKVIWFNGNFGNQIFYCAYKDYLKSKYPNEKIYAFVDPNCPPIQVEERTNLKMPRQSIWVNILSFLVFKVIGVLLRRIPVKYVPKWYCGIGPIDSEATFFAHSLQRKGFYEKRSSDWLIIKEPVRLEDDYLKWKERILTTNSVCVHLRRGDYVNPGSAYVDLSSTDYYMKAMDKARTLFPDAKFFFFSDDLDYVKELFRGDNIYYVDCNKANKGYLDVKLMSLAKVNIMANSTFSYWASYIGNEHKTVIYPKQWFCEWTGRKSPDIMLEKKNWICV